MRRAEEHPTDPEILAELQALDATLAGEPVDPGHAELAELALLLRAERPQIPPAVAASLDRRVEKRFMAPQAARGRPRRWFAPASGLATAAVAGVVAVVVLGSGGGSRPRVSETFGSTTVASQGRPNVSSSSGGAASSAVAHAPELFKSAGPSRSLSLAPHPPANGRRIIQSADLQLTAPANRIDTVAQEVFDVVGRENGVVRSSNVTSGFGGLATFELNVPSSNLTATMTQLSRLRYAAVSSRTDSTQDVNSRYISAGRQLGDDRALRTALLKQLSGATTQTQIDSVKAQLHDAELAIARDLAALRSLNYRIAYSQVQVTISAGRPAVPGHHSGGGFTLGKALHDARQVLIVAAGVALITLAAMVPVALLVALGAWIWWVIRRRRREQALEPA